MKRNSNNAVCLLGAAFIKLTLSILATYHYAGLLGEWTNLKQRKVNSNSEIFFAQAQNKKINTNVLKKVVFTVFWCLRLDVRAIGGEINLTH